jgi:hypothetical protein
VRVVGGNRGGRSNCMPGLSNRMILQPCSFAGTGGSLMVGVGSGGERGVVVCMGGPVQIACLGVELNDCSTQLVATASRSDSSTDRSSRNYPSMFHFVITGVIGF